MRLPPLLKYFVAAGLLAVVAVVDVLTGYNFGFFVFYFLPIGFVAWAAGLTESVLFSILCALIWHLADKWSGNPMSTSFYGYWNAAIRLTAFLVISVSLAKIRALMRNREEDLARELKKALAEVKTLTGLLPICAQCKNIRDDKGYWRKIEEYLSQHTDVRFTHGLCKQCEEKALRDLDLEIARDREKGSGGK